MRFFATLAVAAVPALVQAMLAIKSATYSNGVVTITEYAWPDAPASFDVTLVNSSGQKVPIAQGVTPANGTQTFTVPASVPSGSYTVQLVGAGSNASTVYSGTNTPIAVSGSNSTTSSVTASVPQSTTITESNGSVTVVPVSTTVTTTSLSGSLYTTQSVLTSGSVTTTVAVTGSTNAPVTLTSATGASTATITSRSAGFVGAKAPTVVALMGAAALAVLVI
jgi:hypothetical protein